MAGQATKSPHSKSRNSANGEQHIAEHLAFEMARVVEEAAVAGASDGLKGEVPVAWIVAGDDFDPSALETLCRAKLASFKVPRTFVRVDALPRNALGKVQKNLLGRPCHPDAPLIMD